jgi:hypothetical protein
MLDCKVYTTVYSTRNKILLLINKYIFCEFFRCLYFDPFQYDFHNGVAAASCISGYGGFWRLFAIYTVPSGRRTGARMSKITAASRAQQQLYQHERSSQWTWTEQLFPQQRRTGKKLQLNIFVCIALNVDHRIEY